MGLNVAKRDMYSFVTHTWNTVKGACPHGCTYCYMKRWGKQAPARFDKRELKTELGEDNFIFVGSSCDLFAEGIPNDWIVNTLTKCNWYSSRYLFQSKDTVRMARYLLDDWISGRSRTTACTTIETNRWYPEIMAHSPRPDERSDGMRLLGALSRYVTIEPIMDFELDPLVELVKRCEPVQVNIGADTGRNHLPEPTAFQVERLIDELSKFTKVERKSNLARILP